jgi:transcriptional regulator with XRE-family HTH domain
MESEIGKRIKQLREKKNFTQEELGKEFGISDKSVSFWETKGVRNKKLLQRIADYFGIPLEYLRDGAENNNTVQKGENHTSFGESNAGSNNYRLESVNFNNTQNENTYTGRIREPRPEDYTSVPFIPVTARASFIDRFPDMDYQEMGTFPVYNLDPELKRKGAIVIEVNGDSMEPQLPHRAKVLGLPVDPGDWTYMTGVHAIVYANRFTIKRIISNTLSREGGEVVLKADNGGAEVAVPGSELFRVWKIVRMVDSEVV